MSILKVSLLFLLAIVVNVSIVGANEWAKTVNSGNGKTTNLQFYFHDVQSGKTPSAVPIARAADSGKYTTGFGTLFMADDRLTVGPDPGSKLLGRAQGLYGSAGQDGLALIMDMSYTFSEGVYNGSTISVAGRNAVMQRDRELPVVGGTGVFRMARGYALARTHSADFKTGDAVVGYNVTLFH